MAISFATELDEKVTFESFANRDMQALTNNFRAQAEYHQIENVQKDAARLGAERYTDLKLQAGDVDNLDASFRREDDLRLQTNAHARLKEEMDSKAVVAEQQIKREQAVVKEEVRRTALVFEEQIKDETAPDSPYALKPPTPGMAA